MLIEFSRYDDYDDTIHEKCFIDSEDVSLVRPFLRHSFRPAISQIVLKNGEKVCVWETVDVVSNRLFAEDPLRVKIRELLKQIVITEGDDAGVVLLSVDGPTHYDSELRVPVYDHEFFSPLGDALMKLWSLVND